MKHLPDFLNIQGKTFSVEYRDEIVEDGKNFCGSSDIAEQRIEISLRYPKEGQESTLLHEIIEVINGLNDLNLKHWQISVLETALWQVLKENGIWGE